MVIQLQVHGPRGEQKIMELCDNGEQMKSITVQQLKEKITQQLKIGGEIRMVFGTEQLEESRLLLSYGVRHMSTIHTLLMLPGGI